MTRKSIIVVLASLITFLASPLATASAASHDAQTEAPRATTGPLISSFGPVYPVGEPEFPLRPDRVYRVVFDVGDAAAASDVRNAKIESVARFLNMHARAGVAREDLQAVLVLHGGAGRAALKNEPYRDRFDTDNPDLALLEALHEAGVEIYLCGQTAAHRGLPKAELAAPVELALSAMTVLVTLQNEGWALIAF